jgi:polyisoprenoid-binding protein YceI
LSRGPRSSRRSGRREGHIAHALEALALAALLAFASFACAAADVASKQLLWEIDAVRSEARFVLRALGVIGIEGRIDAMQGEIWRDASGHWVQLRVPLQNLKMSSEKNRHWALSPEFFDAEAHPYLVFTAALPEGDLVPQGSLTGTLTLRGVEAPVQVQLSPRQCVAAAPSCLVYASSEVSRRRFGMQSRRYVVSDKVTLNLTLTLKRSGKEVR